MHFHVLSCSIAQASDDLARTEQLLAAERTAHAAATGAVAELQAQLRTEKEEGERWRRSAVEHESAARRAGDDVHRLQKAVDELKIRAADAEAQVKKGAEEQAVAAAAAKAAADRDQQLLLEARHALAEESAKGARYSPYLAPI